MRLRHAVRLAALLGALFTGLAAQAQDLPQRIRQTGVLRILVNPIYPPMEFKDPATGRLMGLDVDLAEALAGRLGVRVEWQESSFAQLIPSLQTGRADMILSGMSDLPARRETLDFVNYMRSGGQFYVLASSAFREPTDLCGRRVSTSRSTSFPDAIRGFSETQCVAAGRPAITYVPAESTADARTQLRQGRVDAAVQGNETIPYVMSLDPGLWRPIGTPITSVFQGMAFLKADTALRDAVIAAFAELQANGRYREIMARWNLADLAVEGILINSEPRR